MPEQARVLVVSDEMEVGGSQRQITYLLTHLDRRRWQAELLYFRSRSYLADRIEAAGIVVHEIPKRGRIDIVFVLKLLRLLRTGNYAIVYCFSLTAETWVRALLPLAPRLAFIPSIRGIGLGYSDFQWRIKRWIVHRADAVIANARAGARMTAQRTGIAEQRISVIPNAVKLPTPIPQAERLARRDALAIPRGRVCAVFVGRLVAVKNIALLLDALARLTPRQRPFVLLVGTGPLEQALRAQAEQLGLAADVRFLGERADAPDLMGLADFLILPSLEEGLSNVLLEAMAAGCMPLASNVGGNPELIEDGRNGILFAANDVDALAQRLAHIVADAELRTRLGASARACVECDYTLEGLVVRTEALFERVISPRAAPASIGTRKADPPPDNGSCHDDEV